MIDFLYADKSIFAKCVSGAACDINHHHLQNQTAQLCDCKNICSLQQSFVSAPSAIDHHSEFQVGWMIIQKGEIRPVQQTDEVWPYGEWNFSHSIATSKMWSSNTKPHPHTHLQPYLCSIYINQKELEGKIHIFFKNFVFDALKTDCSYQILHLSLFSQRRVSSEIPILIGFRFAINCTTKLYLTASTTRKSETVLKETFWSQCWRRVWYSHVGLKKGVVFTCGSEKASFNRFGAIAC